MKVNVQRMVGLSGLEPLSSTFSGGSAVADKHLVKPFIQYEKFSAPLLPRFIH